ncbi:AAA family ATPase [Deinococcus sp. SL84]|uniref:AAA family ATPase n=1 Tax=Deinococcus sp. SL84 TaxID=2994663 RepID=UPI0022754F9C|nr:AAA family ATPase [Deinococcus sp. SL84]MCY1703806.1 AAA family ATPase [Deinococcus sp. SL84]
MFNPTDHLDNAYQVSSEFDFIAKNTVIPDAQKLKERGPEMTMYAPGIGNAAFALLNNQVELRSTEGGTTISLGGTPLLHIKDLEWTPLDRRAEHALTTPLTGLVMALTTERLPRSYKALLSLVQNLNKISLAFPVNKNALTSSPNNSLVKNALLRLSDTLDWEMRQLNIVVQPSIASSPAGGTQLNLATLLRPKPAGKLSSPKERLARLAQRGGTALLIGPPGTFKTETAKQTAVQEGMQLIIAKGAPGVEDRDFIGGIYPTEKGPQWIDGPLSRAFVSASQGKTLLLIDEVLRYHPENLNVIIGAMDTVSTEEAVAIGIPRSALTGDRHYLLSLPNGDILPAPYENLLWVMTTNIGADHLQTADRFDAALLSRIDLIQEYTYPDEGQATALYTKIAEDPDLAALTYQAELVTRDALQAEGTLLVRSLEARKCIALIREVRSLELSGVDRSSAFLDAVDSIVIPYCVPRDLNGVLDAEAAEMLRRRIEEEVLGL